MLLTREATARDGAVLQTAMTRSPQESGGVVFTLITAPDLFGRARAYDDAVVFVAEDAGTLAGSAAVAVREQLVGGRVERVGYEFQFFTAPEFRRRGVAARLRARIERYLVEQGATLTTAVVAAGNAPSEALFAREGFVRHRALDLTYLFPVQHTDVLPDAGIRPATAADLPAVADLLNQTWAEHDFAPSWTAVALAASLRRTAGLDLGRLIVREERGQLVAGLGVWDWAAVQRVQIEAVAPEARERFPTFRAGEALRQWGLTPVGLRTPADLEPLLRHVGNLARAAGVDQIGLLDEPDGGLVAPSLGIPAAAVGVGLWVKPLRPGLVRSGRPVYVDIVDL